jgi:hypothetical protein
MLGIALDAVVLTLVLAFMNKGETESFGRVILGVVIMTLLNAGVGLSAGSIGALAFVLMFAVDVLFTRSWFGLTWPKALLAVTILFTIKIPIALAFRTS